MINSLKNPDKNIIPERIDVASVMMPLSNSKSGLFTMEIWKDIKGYEGKYQVSNLGKVTSLSRKKWQGDAFYVSKTIILKPGFSGGYYTVRLFKKLKQYNNSHLIHRLVALHFIPNPNNKRCVNHKNGIKNDNRVENLEWVTHKENTKHAVKMGLHIKGESAGASKLKEKEVKEIRKSKLTQKATALKYNTIQYNRILAVL